ncbi:uncharacterized protein LOC134854685 [Symsagittifera roscoffensis]|uniref:uncharacterized protein LOC134854685 n=1 Tax=Symsagittifera roscoffensis TaxID=84072 RepID=UPI00307CAF83
MGHQGVDKVYNMIQERFEWPGLKKACEKWISACLSCQQAKDPRKLRFPLQSKYSSGFNEVVQIDHQKICMTATGYNQVLELMKRSQVAQAHSTTHHPPTNGLFERQNRTLVSMLRVYCSRYMDDWDRHLPQVMGAYNSTEHSTMGKSPHMMLTSHEKALQLTFFYPENEEKRTAPQTYVRDVIRIQQDLNDLCRRNTQQAQIRQKRRFDKRTGDAKAYSVEQTEIDKGIQPDFPLTMETRQSKTGRDKKKYKPYGEDFVIDRIVLSDMMESLKGLDEVAVAREIDLVNDMDQDWIDDRSEPEVEFEPEGMFYVMFVS